MPYVPGKPEESIIYFLEQMFPPHAWLETVCGVRPVLILGYPNTQPHFISSYKEIIVSDMLLDCFHFLKRSTATGKAFFIQRVNEICAENFTVLKNI